MQLGRIVPEEGTALLPAQKWPVAGGTTDGGITGQSGIEVEEFPQIDFGGRLRIIGWQGD
jgi:hypothetical protein